MAVQPVLFRTQKTSNTDRRPSPSIWSDCPLAAIRDRTADGIMDGDDFLSLFSEDGSDDQGAPMTEKV